MEIYVNSIFWPLPEGPKPKSAFQPNSSPWFHEVGLMWNYLIFFLKCVIFWFMKMALVKFPIQKWAIFCKVKPPAPLPARRASRPEGRAYAPEGMVNDLKKLRPKAVASSKASVRTPRRTEIYPPSVRWVYPPIIVPYGINYGGVQKGPLLDGN